ncbi:MAG: hypothetical protein IPL36_13120 [Nigerium sp.]|nr:hypothetical protein [Nigerium sp.]
MEKNTRAALASLGMEASVEKVTDHPTSPATASCRTAPARRIEGAGSAVRSVAKPAEIAQLLAGR